MKVFVYYNLHRRCWSVKALEGKQRGKVILHCSDISLINCTFRVSETGRQRVLREKRKNVHAGVVGFMSDTTSRKRRGAIKVSYDPYKYSSFVDELNKPIYVADVVHMSVKNNKTSVLAFISV